MSFTLRDYQERAADCIEGAWREHTSTLCVKPTGTGKCLGKGTPVLMFDGSIRAVETIRIGDLLMGPDSGPREVLSTCSGREEMFRITPTKGDSYIVNRSHILSLKMTNGVSGNGIRNKDYVDGKILNLSVDDYIGRSNTFKHCAKGYRVGVEFSFKPFPIEPYFVGLWLGDGTSRRAEITTADQEIKDYLRALADAKALRYVEKPLPGNKASVCALSGRKTGRSRIKDNWLRESLAGMGMLGNKHLPAIYKTNSAATRIQVLAGYVDADGSLSDGCYDCVTSSHGLAADIAFLARSLGFAAYLKPCEKVCGNNGVSAEYYRISISGDIERIPVLIARKKAAPRRQKKDVLKTGITVSSIGDGEYFGFEITGDHRFLLGDFTVTHNTVLFAEIIRRRQPGRAIVIAHREELIFQAREKIEAFTGLECEIEMGELVASTSLFHRQPVVIATVQTLASRKRLHRFNPMDFSTVVIDEFHHAPANSYRKVLEYFINGNPAIKVLGVTATPDRADEEALGQVCESVAFNYEILDAIHDGWLVPIEQQFVSIDGLDFSAIRTTAGDLNGADLAAVMEAEKNLHGLCSATLQIIGNRQTIVFTASVKHAEMAANIFNRHQDGIADFVCGMTDKETRRKTMAAMHSGKTQILCNVGVATEGFDCPGVEVIVMGRPTKSRSLYAQMAGRSTRPLPGIVDGPTSADARKQAIAESRKPSCLLVDFVGNSGRHKLMTGADLLGGKYSDEVKEIAVEIMEKAGGRFGIKEALDEAGEELIARQQAETARRLALEEARKARLVGIAKFNSCRINPFDLFGIKPSLSETEGRGKTLSEKQRGILLKQGIDPDSMSYVNAKKLLDEQFRRWNENLCTLKQASLLQRNGIEASNMKREDAKKYIDVIAANRWRWPEHLPRPVAAAPPVAAAEDWL